MMSTSEASSEDLKSSSLDRFMLSQGSRGEETYFVWTDLILDGEERVVLEEPKDAVKLYLI